MIHAVIVDAVVLMLAILRDLNESFRNHNVTFTFCNNLLTVLLVKINYFSLSLSLLVSHGRVSRDIDGTYLQRSAGTTWSSTVFVTGWL